MISWVAAGLVAGLGLLLLVIGRTRPRLEQQLQRLSAQGREDLELRARDALPPLFRSRLLERGISPLLLDAGTALGRLLESVGIGAADLDRRLALGSPGVSPAQFRGQQLAVAVMAGASVPVLGLVGLEPFGPWPMWIVPAAVAAGFAAPSWQLSARLRRRRSLLLSELPVTLDLFVIATSAGLSPEQTLVEAGRQLGGVLGTELRSVVREAGLGTQDYATGLQALADREQVRELRSLADAWRLAQSQGLPLGSAVLALSETVRAARRAQLLEDGGKAAVKMIFPVTLFIFPVFLVVLLYPAGVELLGLGR